MMRNGFYLRNMWMVLATHRGAIPQYSTYSQDGRCSAFSEKRTWICNDSGDRDTYFFSGFRISIFTWIYSERYDEELPFQNHFCGPFLWVSVDFRAPLSATFFTTDLRKGVGGGVDYEVRLKVSSSLLPAMWYQTSDDLPSHRLVLCSLIGFTIRIIRDIR